MGVPIVEMILLDWTRMGRSYCLAGVVAEGKGYRVVRPLPARARKMSEPNVGWSPFLLEGHYRWEIFELVGPEPADSPPPHLEDTWVMSLRPRRRLADMNQRRAILEATMVQGEPLFGEPLTPGRAGTFFQPNRGRRSLTTVGVPSSRITFAGSWRSGAFEPDIRVSLPLPDLGERQLPVKDHFLLAWAAKAGEDIKVQLDALNAGIRTMGERVAVRLGLSRAFPGRTGEQPACWLMADGFFSLSEPQP